MELALMLALLLPLRSFAAMPECAATIDSPAAAPATATATATAHHCSEESPAQHTESANDDSSHHDGTHATASAHDDDSSHHTDSTRHHECGSCHCGAAIAVTAIHWTAPFLPAAPTWEIVHRSAPSVALDRLDRPPRHVPG